MAQKFILNTTYQVEPDVLNEWLSFMKMRFVELVSDTVDCDMPRICRIMTEADYPSFAVQFEIESELALDSWQNTAGKLLYAEISQRFGEKVFSFSTVMKTIDFI